MRKQKAKSKREAPEDDLPAELDPTKLRFIGFGLDALRAHVAKRLKSVQLEPDVAKDFPTAKAVNEGLRTLREIQRMVRPVRSRKTA
jgi:hypothetical protein